MIRFDTENEAREYVSRWLDEQPIEDVHATVVDLVLLLFMEDSDETAEVKLDPEREVEGADFVEHVISNVRSNLEIDEMLLFAAKGEKAEPGSRSDYDLDDENPTIEGRIQ